MYPGVDGEYLLYDDAGDGYGYEQGEYRLLRIRWNDREEKLTYGILHGDLPFELSNDTFGYEIVR